MRITREEPISVALNTLIEHSVIFQQGLGLWGISSGKHSGEVPMTYMSSRRLPRYGRRRSTGLGRKVHLLHCAIHALSVAGNVLCRKKV